MIQTHMISVLHRNLDENVILSLLGEKPVEEIEEEPNMRTMSKFKKLLGGKEYA